MRGQDQIYNLFRKNQIQIVRMPTVRELSYNELMELIENKRNMIQIYNKNMRYNIDTINIMRQENTDIVIHKLSNEIKYKKIYEKNGFDIIDLNQKNQIISKKILETMKDIDKINVCISKKIPYTVREYRYDE